jgi:hypothetical protein
VMNPAQPGSWLRIGPLGAGRSRSRSKKPRYAMLTRCYGGGTMMVYCHANLAAIFRSGSIGALYPKHSSGPGWMDRAEADPPLVAAEGVLAQRGQPQRSALTCSTAGSLNW